MFFKENSSWPLDVTVVAEKHTRKFTNQAVNKASHFHPLLVVNQFQWHLEANLPVQTMRGNMLQ